MKQVEALKILKSGANVFLTGEPGAGKTYTIGQFVKWVKSKKLKYAITASTGIAASHLNGSTIHSWAGIGINRGLTKEQVDKIASSSWVTKRIRRTKVLIIDEISMLDAVTLDDINKVLKAVKKKPLPFGGMQVVFVGDFFQLPPVSRGSEGREFAFDSASWQEANLTVCYLTEQHRQSDLEFVDILRAMRTGKISDEHIAKLSACQLEEEPDTQLFTHNIDVEALNQEELDKLAGPVQHYKMKTRGDSMLVETLKKYCLSPEVLSLKEGAVVMFTRNNIPEGYVNGTIGRVTGFDKYSNRPIITLKNGRTIYPELAVWEFEGDQDKAGASIEQLPLRLAWAITVHKSQGMTLDSALMDLSRTFEYGQGYVAISRVRSLAGLHITGMNDKAFEMHPRVVEQDLKFREVQNG